MTITLISSFWSILSKRAFSTLRTLPRSGRIAWYFPVPSLFGRTAGRIALHEVDLAPGRVLLLAVGQFSGQGAHFQGALAPGQLPGPPGRLPGPGRIQAFAQKLLGHGRIFLEIGADLVVDDPFDEPLDFAVTQLGFGLPLELGISDLDADDTGQPLPQIFPLEGFLAVFQDVVLVA